MRNFQKISENLNVFSINHSLQRQSDLWGMNDFRKNDNSPHREADDIIIRYCKIDQKSTIKNVIENCNNVFYPAWKNLPQIRSIIFDLMRSIEGIELGRVIITRLSPGKIIYPHIDDGPYAKEFDRYHIALVNNPGILFKCGDEEISSIKSGDIWWFDNTKTHSIVNNSGLDRITLIVDYRRAP